LEVNTKSPILKKKIEVHMKQALFILPLIGLLLPGCSTLQRTMRAMECNSQAIEMSTQAILENRQAVEEANYAIDQNRRQLERINQELRSVGQ
jgi:hypothetical protein